MKKSSLVVATLILLCASAALRAQNWPAFRGPLMTGEGPGCHPPTEWSEEKNIKWKVAIPGKGHATPIIWGDRIFIQTAVETSKDAPDAPKAEEREDDAPPPQPPEGERRRGNRPPNGNNSGGDAPSQISPPLDKGLRGDQGGSLERVGLNQPGDQPPPEGERRRGPRGPGGPGGRQRGPRAAPTKLYEFKVIALDRATGKTLWDTTVCEERPHEAGHGDSTQASNSPVTDGKHIYAFFGSRGVYCLTMDGKVKWKANLGKMTTRNGFGEGASPALHGDTLIIDWDHEGDDFIVAFDKKSGKEKWRVARDEHTNWSTPLVVDANGKSQVVVSATGAIRSYDLDTGKEIWSCKGMTESVIPSPMVLDDLLICISGFRGAACVAIKYKEAKGDVTGTETIAWQYDKNTPYVPSAVLYNSKLYFLENTKPMVTCLDAKSGKPIFTKQRLTGLDSIYSSLVGAGGHVYIVGRNGTTVVLKDGDELTVAATNKLDDGFDASPAMVGDELYLRGREHLYCIAKK